MSHKYSPDRAFNTAHTRVTLVQALLAASKRVGGLKPVLEDHERKVLSYNDLILAASVLGKKLASLTSPGERVGILLPNSIGIVVTFFGLQVTRRVPAMLNYSAGAHNVDAACRVAQVRSILTSRKFVEAGKLEDFVAHLSAKYRIVYLEDVRANLSIVDKLVGLVASKMLPIERGDNPDNVAAILFTSGAEGAPKAVALSHANFVSNVEQIRTHIELDPEWIFFNPLPVFHSFGLTGGVLLPLLSGMRVFQYPSPLHHKQIPELVRDTRANILFATDTFLSQYARAAGDGDLSGLTFVVCGAERVRQETRRLMTERFSVPVIEGYGATEASPVIAVNNPDRNLPGSVGQLLPGIQYHLDPVDGIADGGRLLLRGPNVMLGYLDQSGQVVQPIDGWHDTGDVVSVNPDRYVTIQGRLKRFAKIAGEMVSLNAVEARTALLWPDNAHAAIAVEDERRGESILLLTDRKGADRQDLLVWGKQNDWPDLHMPRRILIVERIPLLATGKTDYVAAEKLAKGALMSAHGQ